MSTHKNPRTIMEDHGLMVHGLPRTTPSQLSDVFIQGMDWVWRMTLPAPREEIQGREYRDAVTSFQEGQWWIQELDEMVKEGTPDQKRAVAVVRNLLNEAHTVAEELDTLKKDLTQKGTAVEAQQQESLVGLAVHNKILRTALGFLNQRIVTMELGGVVERALALPDLSTSILNQRDVRVLGEAVEVCEELLLGHSVFRSDEAFGIRCCIYEIERLAAEKEKSCK